MLRLDAVTIFPEYFAPLDLSLIGKARRDGLVELVVHDLRDFTHDRHRTVDDSPLGGGAGMVMRPEPWAEAILAVLAAGREALGEDAVPDIVLTSPAGRRFDHAAARELAEGADWIVYLCGRYEGFDERVHDWLARLAARGAVRLRPLSIGDYVLNGGEVAALVVTEAVVRLIPGVVGNPESVVEESHADGLLEYPVYTRPAAWTDPDGVERAAPEVLLSGHHGRVRRWRRDEALRRTAARRPDMLSAYPDDRLDRTDRAVLAELEEPDGAEPGSARPGPA
jgi:tRNA (guanine37-N1)-methyltransferase